MGRTNRRKLWRAASAEAQVAPTTKGGVVDGGVSEVHTIRNDDLGAL